MSSTVRVASAVVGVKIESAAWKSGRYSAYHLSERLSATYVPCHLFTMRYGLFRRRVSLRVAAAVIGLPFTSICQHGHHPAARG